MKKRLVPIIILLLALVALMIGGCSGKEIPIERIALTSLPKLEYLKGETFDLGNAKLAVYYSNGTSETMPLTAEMVSNYDPQDIGEHVLTIKYENVFTNIKIRITNAPIVRVEPTKVQLDYKTEYIESQELDLTNLKLKIYYESGDPDIIPVTADMVSGFNPDTVGSQQLTIKYLNNYQTTLTVNVSPKKVLNISNHLVPDKELYLINEKITKESLAGGILFVTYDNGYTQYIPFPDLYASQEQLDAALSYDTSHAKSREIVTLNYGGKSVIFAIAVLEKEAKEFTILNNPSEIQIVGTELSLRGGQLSIDYNNLTTEIVNMTDAKVRASGYDKTRVGVQTITLSFTDIKKTFSFEINVVETKPSSLEILLPVVENGVIMRYSQAIEQNKVTASFYEEGTIDLSFWEYRLKMDNGSYSAIYPVENDMLRGDAGRLYLDENGSRNFEFEYNRDETSLAKTVAINVFKKELLRITVTPPTNNIFYARAELILTGARFTAYFNDGATIENAITRDMVSGFNNTQLGNQDVIVTYTTEKYGTKISSFKVLVIRRAESIQFESVSKTTYVLGQSFDMLGLEMRIHYEGSVQSERFIGPFGNEWTFENTQFDTLGHHEVTVKYQATGLTLQTTIPVYVKNDLVSLKLVKFVEGEYLPAANLPQVVAGMAIDFTNYYIDCTLENGGEKVVLEQIMTDYQRADKTAGVRTVTIIYGGLSIQTTLNVVERQISSLELLSPPDKHYYKAAVPAALDITGLTMRLSYSNMTSISLSAGTLSQQNTDSLVYRFMNEESNFEYITLLMTELDTQLAPGVETEERTILIAIESFEVGFDIVVAYKIATSATWDISEGGAAVDQPSITALQGLDNIDFAAGASFKVVYNDGEFSEIKTVADEIDGLVISEFDYNTKGTQVIDIRYQDIYFDAVVSVRPKDLYSVELAPGFFIPDVTEGMPLDLRQAKIIVTYYHDMGTPDSGDDIILPSSVVSLSSSMTDYIKADGRLGMRSIIIRFSYIGNRTETRELNFDITVKKKQLDSIGMGMIPKTKYVELDQYDFTNGTIILYYNNNTTLVLPLSESKKVRSAANILPTDHYILNYGQFDNTDFSGFSKKQQIYITYKEGDAVKETSYDIIMHDRMYAEVIFAHREEYNADLKTYYFWYGEDKTISYQILGYLAHTDMPQSEMLAEMELVSGINYTYKYINQATGEEFSEWPRDAGTYRIIIDYDADSPVNNDRIHNSFINNERTVVIRPKNIHIAPNSVTKVYGENDPSFSSIISAIEYKELNGGGTEIILHTDNVFGYNDTAASLGGINYTFPNAGHIIDRKKAPVGTYVMNVSVAAHRNYTFAYAEAQYTVTKRDIIIIADSKTKEYGQPDPAFTFTTAAVMGNDKSGLIQGDGFSGYLLRSNAGTSNGVGSYAILLGSLKNDNYNITFVSNTLSIYKRKLILTAKSYSKIYGEPVPFFEVTASSERETPFAYTDSVFSLGGSLVFVCKDSFDNNISASTSVGSYTIMPQGYQSSNYDIEYRTGIIEITRRKVSVTAAAKQKIYGTETDPALTFTASVVTGDTKSGIYASDTLNGSLTRQSGENAATYSINQGTVTNVNNPNYDIIFVPGVFTITKRTAQIELKGLSRQYNGLLPSVEQENIILHGASGDIKNSITITFINPSQNIGTYTVGFTNNDTNHNLSFLAAEGYRFVIAQKEVSTEFYNIPYGALEGGQYAGSVYKGAPYNYEARVPSAEICAGDTVKAVIYTAELLEGGATPIYLDRTGVTNVGRYSVKVMSLTNNNYKMRTPQEGEPDYRITEFRIIPATIKVLINTYSKSFTGGDLSLNNSLTKIEGYYKSMDYQLLTPINFVPYGLNVYPYYINMQQQERLPRSVLYQTDEEGNLLTDEFGEYIIGGYNMKVVTGNKNYTAVLVDAAGVPLEIDEGEIVDEAYRFKVLPKILDIILQTNSVTKEYDGKPPQVTNFGLSSPQIDKEQEVFFEYVRNNEYPAFMEGHITDADNGTFTIIPRTTNMNFRLRLSPSTNYDYTIRVKTLYSCDFGSKTIKQYDGLVPEISSEFFNFGGYSGDYTFDEIDGLAVELDFGETALDAKSYKFTAKFKFPRADAQFRVGYEDYLDYNHRFQSISLITDLDYKIEKRQVMLSMIETNDIEGYNWKYYNGLAGAALPGDINKFSRGFIIVDAKASDPDSSDFMETPVGGTLQNGEDIKIKHLLNENSETLLTDLIAGNLELEYAGIRAAETYSAVRTANITGNASNSNFAIQVAPGTYRFSIRRQIIFYHFEETYKTYGETISTAQYNFALNPLELEKVVEAASYPDNLFDAATGLFPSNRFSPYALSEQDTVNYMTPVGSYDIKDANGAGISIGNYTLRHNEEASKSKLIIVRRELPVNYIENRGDYFVVTRVYGDDLDKVNFIYTENNGSGKGLMSWDREAGLTASEGFDRPSVSFVEGVGDDIARNAGIILEDSIIVDFLDEGENTNYFFSYDAFLGNQPKLEIKKAPLVIKVTNSDYNGLNDPSISAVYGTPPTEAQYKYVYNGFKLGQNHLTADVMNITYTLPQTTMVIGGETITFNAVSGSIDMSGKSITDILGVNLNLPVNYDNGVQPNPLTASLSYNGKISRQATNGNYYDFSPANALAAYLTNYDVTYDATDYTVTKRPIEIRLELLYEGVQGTSATFNMLWDETPYMISKEKVLLHSFTKEELLNLLYSETEILLAVNTTAEMLLYFETKEQILILAGKIGEDNTLTPEEIDQRFGQLIEPELRAVFDGYMTPEKITTLYGNLTTQQFEEAYEELYTSENIESVYAAQAYTEEQLETLYNEIILLLNEDERRLVYAYRYDESQLVYGDEIGIGTDIDISGIALNYTTGRGENKTLSAKGVFGNNYQYIYVASKLNIYRYITSIGDNNELPNIMLTGEDEFMVKVNYVDGSSEYLSFTAPRATDYTKQVPYTSEFSYNGAAIEMLSAAPSQTISITIDEEIFGYKQFSINSHPFKIRLFNQGDDQKLWGRAVDLGGGNTGGAFYSSNGAAQLGQKISGNYTYYLSNDNGTTAGTHDFDIIDTAFTLSPKAGVGAYYFELILNGDGTANNYLAMRFNSGNTEQLTLYGKSGGVQVFGNTLVKPAELDLFDGRIHNITVYIDKLGTRTGDSTGYRVLSVIDNVYYFSFAIGKSYTPYFASTAGFEGNNCFAWVSRYNVYRQGMASSLALTLMPTASSYLSQSYSVAEVRTVDFAALTQSYTFFNSSYKSVINTNLITYEYILDGFQVESSAMLPIGAYVLETKMYYDGVYMDTLTIYISISQNYSSETLSNGIVSTKPYMANPVTYYGYNYDAGADMTITAASETNIAAANVKNFRYFKSVFELDFATLPGGSYPDVSLPVDYNPNYPDKWMYPYSAAVILKTTDPASDLRNPNVTSPNFNGIGLYIRYNGTTYFTKVFIRINGLLYYSQDYTNIIWSGTQRTVVEASFDDTTGCIYLYIENDGIMYTMRIGNGFETVGDSLTASQIMNVIVNPISTSAIRLVNTRGRIYQMETGIKQLLNRNYYNLTTGELKANTDVTLFSSGEKIFLENGSGRPLVANYDTYTIRFKATHDNNNGYNNTDYVRFLLGSNKPTFENTSLNDNRGFYIGYQKMYYPQYLLDTYVMYFTIYKCGIEYSSQYLYALTETQGISGVGPDLFDGQIHTLKVSISKSIMTRNYQQDNTNGEVIPYFSYDTADMQVYAVTVSVDGTNVGTGYIPVVNDLSNWSISGSSATDMRYDGIYDTKFLSSNLYAGVNVLNANLEVEYLRVE